MNVLAAVPEINTPPSHLPVIENTRQSAVLFGLLPKGGGGGSGHGLIADKVSLEQTEANERLPAECTVHSIESSPGGGFRYVHRRYDDFQARAT
jgi:hypothetical protein